MTWLRPKRTAKGRGVAMEAGGCSHKDPEDALLDVSYQEDVAQSKATVWGTYLDL